MATERWYWVDCRKKQLMKHVELDGAAYLRQRACSLDTPVDIDAMSDRELRRAMRDVVAALISIKRLGGAK